MMNCAIFKGWTDLLTRERPGIPELVK